MKKIEVYWLNECTICKNPMNLHVNTNKLDVLSKLVLYSACCELDLRMNKRYFMRGSDCYHKICKACFKNCQIRTTDLINREIRGKMIKKHKSLSQERIYEWFERANKFINNQDINWLEFLNDESKIYNVRIFCNDVEYST